MSGGTGKAEAFAAALLPQAAWPALVVLAGLIVAPVVGLGGSPAGPIFLASWVLVVGNGAAIIALSALLVFDAWLFRLMASHASETGGGAAVDEVLNRMRLKPAASAGRTLEQRIAGTRRLLTKQRVLLVVFLAAFVGALR